MATKTIKPEMMLKRTYRLLSEDGKLGRKYADVTIPIWKGQNKRKVLDSIFSGTNFKLHSVSFKKKGNQIVAHQILKSR